MVVSGGAEEEEGVGAPWADQITALYQCGVVVVVNGGGEEEEGVGAPWAEQITAPYLL